MAPEHPGPGARALPAGWFSIGPDHPALSGHFPGNPLVPGVVLLDQALALASDALARMGEDWPETAAAKTAPRAAVRQAKFRKPVRPGEILEVRLDMQPAQAPTLVCTSAGTLVLTCSLAITAAAESRRA